MSESALTSFGRREVGPFKEFDRGNRCDDQLRDPLAMFDPAGHLPQIDEEDAKGTSIVAVDGAGSIENGKPVGKGQPAARANLSFKSRGYGQRQARGNQCATAGDQFEWLSKTGPQIETCGSRRHSFRCRCPWIQPDKLHRSLIFSRFQRTHGSSTSVQPPTFNSDVAAGP